MATRVAAVLDPTKPYSPLSVPNNQTALLLMDYQNMTVSMLGEAGTQIVHVAQGMRSWAIKQNIAVFHCIIDTKSGAGPRSEMKAFERWKTYEEKLRQMPHLGDIPDELAPPDGSQSEKVITRTPGMISVLKSPGLVEELKTKQIRSLIMCGLSTSNCVFSSVRAATDEHFIVTVVEDACADPVPELHDLLMKHALTSTAHVVGSHNIQEVWVNGR